MSYYVRPMSKEDIPQATAIDREAFPTMWPPTNFQHELQNWLARYIVACEGATPDSKTQTGKNLPPKGFRDLVSRLKVRLRGKSAPIAKETVIGLAGFWVMADEAHVTNIAVREPWRGKGVGELLLMSVIEQAIKLNAQVATLEVRASNALAQNLYRKYGFSEAGVRRGYYTDNKEDALIMTTEKLTSASFQTRLKKLKEAYARKRHINTTEIMPAQRPLPFQDPAPPNNR